MSNTRFLVSTVDFYSFKDLATAQASTRKFRNNAVIRVRGDNTRFKFGDGLGYGQGSTFAQLPWINTAAGITKTALNATGTLTAATLLSKVITSTSAAAVTGTLDTATNLGAALGAGQGTEFDFVVDNTAGANTFTVAVGTGITAITPVITGGATLTVAAGTAGKFKLYFKSATAAILIRVF